MENQSKEIKKLGNKIQQLSISLEKSKIMEYVNLMEDPRRLLALNFAAGLPGVLAWPLVFDSGALVILV